jgi:hypothetical protein
MVRNFMELDFFTFEHIDDFNLFVQSEKKEGRIVIPVSVLRQEPNNATMLNLTVLFYYAP